MDIILHYFVLSHHHNKTVLMLAEKKEKLAMFQSKVKFCMLLRSKD